MSSLQSLEQDHVFTCGRGQAAEAHRRPGRATSILFSERAFDSRCISCPVEALSWRWTGEGEQDLTQPEL